jgi:glucokinase
MPEVLIAYDVGGTNSRVHFALYENRRAVAHPDLPEPVSRPRRGTGAFIAFVEETLGMLPKGSEIAGATCAFAGPVAPDGSVCMTNWPEPRCLEREDLVEAGLPGDTRIVNDMVAGAEGVIDRVEHGGDGLVALHDPEALDTATGNVVYLAPGTGLGAATLVRTGLSDPSHVAVGCECQHTAMPVFAEDMGACLDALTKMLGRTPTWEDVVSGRGIPRVHAAIEAIEFGTEPSLPADDAEAGAIAEAAADGDPVAMRALVTYYRALGKFAQLLALAEQPCAGVFIGGRTTEVNLEIVRQGDMVREFLENRTVGQALSEVGVHVVHGDVNLAGALRIAAQAARARPPKSTFRSFGGQ